MRSMSFLLLTAFLGLLFTTPAQSQTARHRRSYTKTHWTPKGARTVHVNAYNRHMKSGKIVHVHAYNRSKARHH